MSYKVLAVGGSYFLGRVFTTLASRSGDFDLALINRGRYSMSHLSGVTEYRCDRHNAICLSTLPAVDYDAVVDLCAYSPGDISFLLDHLPGSVKRYIFISTADVYQRPYSPGTNEDSPLQSSPGSGPAAEYTFNKRMLEDELLRQCSTRGIEPVILRPSFIYGPYNYAPRESWFIQQIIRRGEIPVPTDSKSSFQFVYVKDAAEAIIKCIGAENAAGEAYNLSAPEILTYNSFADVLGAVSDVSFSIRGVTVEQVLRENIPLPFPLVPEDNELFSGKKITASLGLTYTPFKDGLEKTFLAFKPVYM